jgi:hypothetical protein
LNKNTHVFLRKVTMVVALTSGLAVPYLCRAQAGARASQADPAATSATPEAVPASPDQSAVSSATSSSADEPQLVAQDAPAPAPAAQQTPAAAPPATPAAAPMPLSLPSMTQPLSTAAPQHTIGAGPFGTLDVTGVLSGFGMVQDNWISGDKNTNWDVSNAQVFVQKTTGWWQFYLQAGAYSLPAVGVPYLSDDHTLSNFYGPLPEGFMKFVKGNFSVMVGELPTLIGAEYTFSFENLNIERGLLWSQETAISRGIQLNETYKKLTASLSWNDGFYSNRYTWLSGSVAYALNASNTISFVAAGNAGQYKKNTLSTPLYLNNSSIYNLIYTYTHGNWYIQPYWQYTSVPTAKKVGILHGADTDGGALLFNYNFKHGVSLALRPEYIATTGSVKGGTINLLYGPGSGAFSFTVTPTYQKDGFFARADLSVVDARSYVNGDAFGYAGNKSTQTRGVIEAGFMF